MKLMEVYIKIKKIIFYTITNKNKNKILHIDLTIILYDYYV